MRFATIATSQDTCPKTALIAKTPLASVVAKRATLDAIALLLPRAAVLQVVVRVIDVDSPVISRATARPMLVDSPTITPVTPVALEVVLEAASATSADVLVTLRAIACVQLDSVDTLVGVEVAAAAADTTKVVVVLPSASPVVVSDT